MAVDPVILQSARKHGIHDHACSAPTVIRSASSTLDGLTMLIGAATDGRLLEIGVADAEGIEFIVHAMTVRNKFLR